MPGPETITDPVMAEIGDAVQAGHAGDRAGAGARFDELWPRLAEPFHRCALAHYAADVQDDPHEELRWDERALAAADEVTDGPVHEQVTGFYPSLHLNLADVHRRLGHDDEARRHLASARDRVGVLPDDGYGRMIRGGIDRCAERLGEPG